jgi:hypothetical protein
VLPNLGPVLSLLPRWKAMLEVDGGIILTIVIIVVFFALLPLIMWIALAAVVILFVAMFFIGMWMFYAFAPTEPALAGIGAIIALVHAWIAGQLVYDLLSNYFGDKA